MATTYMNLTLPVPGPGGTAGPTWASELNDALTTIDAHDHSSGNGVQIGVGGLNIQATLSLNNNVLSGVQGVALQLQTAAPSTTSTIWASGSSGDLYWRNAAGTSVQLTSGGAINIAGVGGFTGDYTAAGGGVTAKYTSATGQFDFLRGTSTQASASFGDIKLVESKSGVTNGIWLKSPASLAATYNFIYPAAAPSTRSFVALDQNGQLSTMGSAIFEDSTWTPQMFIGGVVQTRTATHISGSYQRVGNWVTFSMDALAWQLASASNSSVVINGLPYSGTVGINWPVHVAINGLVGNVPLSGSWGVLNGGDLTIYPDHKGNNAWTFVAGTSTIVLGGRYRAV